MDSEPLAETPSELHPWVVMTEACLNRGKPEKDGFIHPHKVKRLNACVGKGSVHRSMLIWDQILKAVEAGGFKVRMEKEPPCRTIVTVDGEELSISLKEKTTRKEHIPTPEEEQEMKKYKFLHGVPTWDYLPSGRLVLAIDYFDKYKQKVNEVTWTDGEKKRIEDRLGKVADVLMEIAKDLKECRARAAEWQRQQDEERRRERAARRLRVREKRRVKLLKKQLSAWKQAVSMRRFIHAVRELATSRNGVHPGSPLEKWLQWAEAQADKIDPVPLLAEGKMLEAERR